MYLWCEPAAACNGRPSLWLSGVVTMTHHSSPDDAVYLTTADKLTSALLVTRQDAGETEWQWPYLYTAPHGLGMRSGQVPLTLRVEIKAPDTRC